MPRCGEGLPPRAAPPCIGPCQSLWVSFLGLRNVTMSVETMNKYHIATIVLHHTDKNAEVRKLSALLICRGAYANSSTLQWRIKSRGLGLLF